MSDLTKFDTTDPIDTMEAIRELAKAVEAMQERLAILDGDVNDLRGDIRNVEDTADS